MSIGDIVLTSIRPVIVRYCRARIGRRDTSFAVADLVAKEAMYAVLRAVSGSDEPLLAVIYRIAADYVNKELRDQPGCADAGLGLSALPADQREIIVLRAICGLTAEQTAVATGRSPSDVRLAQHRALTALRNAPRLTQFGHGGERATLSEYC